nr:MAG TPA: tumor necrosis factor receptor superfamily member 19 [Caudoviricetes sp.]
MLNVQKPWRLGKTSISVIRKFLITQDYVHKLLGLYQFLLVPVFCAQGSF